MCCTLVPSFPPMCIEYYWCLWWCFGCYLFRASGVLTSGTSPVYSLARFGKQDARSKCHEKSNNFLPHLFFSQALWSPFKTFCCICKVAMFISFTRASELGPKTRAPWAASNFGVDGRKVYQFLEYVLILKFPLCPSDCPWCRESIWVRVECDQSIDRIDITMLVIVQWFLLAVHAFSLPFQVLYQVIKFLRAKCSSF